MDTTNNKMIDVTVKCNAFIVPNSAAKADIDFYMGKKLVDFTTKLAALNNFEYDPEKDRFIQMWWYGAGVLSKNMQDHGFTIPDKPGIGCNYYHFSGRDLHYIPESVLKGHIEGDTISLKIPLKPECNYNNMLEEDEDLPTFMITFNITLKQQGARYERFGRFEDVLGRLLNIA